jgi:hypothetical protein
MAFMSFVRDLLIAIVCGAVTLICGAFAGLGLLIAINLLPSEEAAIAALILAPPAVLIAGNLLQRIANPFSKFAGNVVFALGAVLLGSSLGFLALYFVRPRGADDYGPLYSLCGLGGVLGTGIAFRGSGLRLLSRSGTIMIVLASLLATSTAEMFSRYSYAAAKMPLSDLEKTLITIAMVALLIAVPVATAFLLSRADRKVQPAGSAGT